MEVEEQVKDFPVEPLNIKKQVEHFNNTGSEDKTLQNTPKNAIENRNHLRKQVHSRREECTAACQEVAKLTKQAKEASWFDRH